MSVNHIRLTTVTALVAAFAASPPAQSPPSQTQPATQRAQATSSEPKLQLSPDELAYQAASRIKDPQERTDAFIKFVAEYPKYPYIRNTVFYLGRSFKDLVGDPEKIRSMVDRFVEGTAGAPRYARSEFYYGISKALAANSVLLDRAADLAQKGIALLEEADYVENERRMAERKRDYEKQRNRQAKPQPFSEAEAREKFRAFRAGQHANLGQIYLKQGKLDGAQEALLEAYRIQPVMESATGLSEIMEKRGNAAEAFSYLADAALTGRLSADKIAHLEDLYRKTLQGSPEGFQEALDRKYRQGFRNPLQVRPYQPAAGRSDRVVLAEFVTGAGCEPCTAVDLAFDTELQRYSRNELALLVYHMHAPTSDPMCNHSADLRHKFYDAKGAPTVFIDGQLVHPGEGLRTEAERVYASLDEEISSRLKVPAQARLKVDARIDGSRVRVSVAGEAAERVPGLRLQIALVEKKISYSGENGLRFHPMVVRNLAQPASAEKPGFPLNAGNGGKFEYVFDLDRISAANLKYYDEYIADLKKRTNGLIIATFREKRYLINPDNLSVVAFIQDEATKQVLQAAYVEAPSAH